MAGSTGGKAQGSARRQGASRRSAGPETSSASALRWYLAGVVSGVFVCFIVYMGTLPGENEAATVAAQAPATGVSEPRYEFFDVLPRQSIEVQVDPAELPKNREAGVQDVYLLQAGSFRQAEDADRRRAELLLLGLEPSVEEINGGNGRWFRVLLGPFNSRSLMSAARSVTAQQNIDTLVVKRGANG